MARVAVSAGLALAFVSTGEAFAFTAPHALAQRRSATPQLRQATAAHVRPQQRGALHAQLRPEDEQMKSARPKFELGNAWQDFVGAAREGWTTGADARATASLPNVLLVPVWIGVAAMGLFLPAPQLLESMFMGMNHGVESANAVDLSAAMQSVQAVALAGAKSSANIFGASQGGLNLQELSNPGLDPSSFVPVCQFSDGFYRTAQGLVYRAAGKATYQEYSPLIAGSLLRVRLEFCVLESFVYESILPFVRARGLSWVFPLKETLETFVAGTVFAVATNLVLIGSTKIITIVVSYADFFVGLPLRLVFGFTSDRLKGLGAEKNALAPVYVATTGLKVVGLGFGGLRKIVEGADIFVGRYLLLTTVGYVGLKFLKFKGVLTIESIGAFFSGAGSVVSTLGSAAKQASDAADVEMFMPVQGFIDTIATIDSSLYLHL